MKLKLIIALLAITASISAFGQKNVLSAKIMQNIRQATIEKADQYLNEKPVTVTASFCKRSAGGVHDFYSEGDYWWPDPKDPKAPYIKKDGESNPDNFSDHRHAMVRFSDVVATLTSAWILTGEQKYADKALVHLNAWFTDPKTMMNPNLLYAQAISGRFTGRGVGIIDVYHLVEVAQSVKVLSDRKAITAEQSDLIKSWFKSFLTWMTTHPYGIDEMNAENNHGTCWVVSAGMFAKLTGNESVSKMCVDRFKNILLPRQMADNGSLPRELDRTKPFGYSLFNMDAFASVAQILSTPDDNLFDYTTPDGKSLKKGMEFIAPYIADKSTWPYAKDIYIWEEWPARQSCLLFTGLAYNNPEYISLYLKLPANPTHPEVLRNLPVRHPAIWMENSTANLNATCAAAPECKVNDIGQLNECIQKALPGDVIVMQDGVWTNAALIFSANGMAEKPIVLKAQTPGKVILSGNSSLTFTGKNLKVDGLVFTNGTSDKNAVITFNSDSCRLTNTVIENYNPSDYKTKYYWIYFNGNHNRMDHCYFNGKSNLQPLVGNDISESRYNRVDSCYFKDIPYRSDNGREIFRIWGYGGNEELGADGAYFTVEYNLFDGAHGEGAEIISLKSNYNTVQFNTILASKGGIVGRSGNYNTIQHNLIIGKGVEGSAGLRLAGQGHVVNNNYVADVTECGLILMAGESFEKDLTGKFEPILRQGTPLGRVPRYGHVRNGQFANNILINTGGVLLGSTYKSEWPAQQRVLLPEGNAFVNNLIQQSKESVAFEMSVQDQNKPLDVFKFAPNTFNNNFVYMGSVKLPVTTKGIALASQPLMKMGTGVLYEPTQKSVAFSQKTIDSLILLSPKNVGPNWIKY